MAKITALKKNIIHRLLKPPQEGDKSRFWPREMKLVKQLLTEFPDQEFWAKATFPEKYNSLAWFLSSFGRAMVKRRISEFHFVPTVREEVKVSVEKVGDSIQYDKRPRFLFEFLR